MGLTPRWRKIEEFISEMASEDARRSTPVNFFAWGALALEKSFGKQFFVRVHNLSSNHLLGTAKAGGIHEEKYFLKQKPKCTVGASILQYSRNYNKNTPGR
jgi:hypothetical protein